MRIGITIPVFLSSDILLDFTHQTLESLSSENHEIYIYLINNFSLPEFYPKQDDFVLNPSIKGFTVIDNPKGNEVGAAWNLGIKTALEQGCEYVMVLNNDLILHPKCVDNLMKFAQEYPEFILWSASEWVKVGDVRDVRDVRELREDFSEHPHFSFFMVNQKTMDTVGWFDENLKMAYFEDSEFHTRILLSDNKAGKIESAKFYHYGSRTIKVDENLYDQNKRNYEDNREYVRLKWGVDFHGQIFVPPEKVLEVAYKTPFNNSEKGIKDW